MKQTLTFLLLPLLFFACTSASSQTIPSDVIGTWSGQVIEHGRSDYYTVDLKIWQGSAGVIIGSVGYPDYGCGGDLRLITVKVIEGLTTVKMNEQLSYGKQECINDGEVWVAIEGGKLKFQWKQQGLDFAALGYLYKQ